ncbi:hypothetical protein [Oceanicoccus sp. KOV_DT_Chl]|uniref:hypothetical protein n=1 Tax=Oceanicoccus sp. KOV_DT_Chl TaxID=1904639 RepID=UPI000C7CF649|nr:hypothetical protein [Oceanicoccus sp. KOV_DT_Chl]
MGMFSEYPVFSLVVAGLLVWVLMYFLRQQAHHLILRSARLCHAQLRLLSRACLYSAQRIRRRNHEITKALAEALLERQLERRFMRIEKLVERDLANYQHLAADINRQLTAVDEDYIASAKVPDISPEWVAAVEAISALEGDQRNSDVMNKILEDMHQTVKEHQREALREHRWTVSSRHKVLSGLQPQWRKLGKMLQHIDNNIDVLRHRLRQVDQHMSQFEMITAGSGQGIMASMLMRFVSSLCFVLVGVGAAWINWQLLLQPISALLPVQAGELPLAAVVTGLHIAVTLVAATMVSESLRITHLFPLVSAMTRYGRQVMVVIGTTLLVALTAGEALALLGSPIQLAATEMVGASQILLVVLGVLIPLVLALVVIPLEYMLHTVRPVFGSLLQVMLHISTLLLRLVGSAIVQLSRMLIHVYDAIIFVPLLIEQQWQQRQQAKMDAAVTLAVEASEPNKVTALRLAAAATEQRH